MQTTPARRPADEQEQHVTVGIDWRALVRAEFPRAAREVYLGRTNPVFVCRRAIEEAQRSLAAMCATPESADAEWPSQVERVRARFAEIVGAHVDEIVVRAGVLAPGIPITSSAGRPVECVDVSADFGMTRGIARRDRDIAMIAAHGISVMRVPRHLVDAVPASTSNRAGIAAVGGALDVVAEIGIAASAARVRDLAAHLRAGLDRHSVEIASQQGRTVVVRSDRPPAVVSQLNQCGIVASVEPGGVGLSVHLFTREADLDRAVDALAATLRGETTAPTTAPEGPLVCVDLNGVLDAYQGWKGAEHWDSPAPGSREFLMALRARGCRVVLFTTRYYRDAWRWLEAHGLGELIAEVTDRKPPADVFVDDRAVPFTGDYDAALRQVEQFAPHWARQPGDAGHRT
jgi:hypothetical protein